MNHTSVERVEHITDSELAAGETFDVAATDLSIGLSPQDTLELQANYEYLDVTLFMSVIPEEGTIEINAEDGSCLLLNVATGSMNTVSST